MANISIIIDWSLHEIKWCDQQADFINEEVIT